MPSDAKTPLGLSQWVGGDRPKREDFNTDNQKIDLACRSALTSLSAHLEGDAHPSALSQQRWDMAAGHMGEGIATSMGMHGLRFYQGVLEVNVGGVWTPCAAGGGKDYKVYGVCVDTLEPDPEASVTYTDDAVGLIPGSADWDNTFIGALQPCLLKNGNLACYLQKDNYRLTADGQPADIESGEGGDVMVQVPKMAFAIYMEGTKLYVKVTDYPEAPHLDRRFCYNAHTRLVQGDREHFYVGAYLGSLLGGKLRSLSGKDPLVSQTLLSCRDFAHTTGAGYELLGYYPFLLLQCLYLIRYKSRHSQRSIGMGYVTQYFTGKTATGGADGKGLFYGESTGQQQMKLFGIEDFWGNISYFLDGLRTDENLTLWTATSDFASRKEGVWRNLGRFPQQPQELITRVHGNNDAGFLVTATDVTTSDTYWCDGGAFFQNSVAYAGGDFATSYTAGAFYTAMRLSEDTASPRTGARLMYL